VVRRRIHHLNYAARGVQVACAALAGALIASACTSADSRVCKVHAVGEALTNAADEATYLGLAPSEELAVIDVQQIETDAGPQERCSGVLVDERHVLTAAHCAPDPGAELRLRFGSGTGAAKLEAHARVAAVNPDIDLMVLELSEPPGEDIGVVPLPVASALPAGFAAKSLVQLAGFGRAADGSSGQRGFSVEQVQRIADATIRVTAHGLGGACFGDSGGPLLVRGDDGRVYVLGILASGTTSCFGQDSYARVDALGEWLRDSDVAVSPSSPSAAQKPAFRAEGRCFDERAVWFSGGRLHAEVCEHGTRCGWSPARSGYRCVDRDEDPCMGIDDLGVCRQGIATNCRQGRLVDNPCADCDLACARSPRSGAATCIASRDAGAP
jgi:hypothetical protein